MSEKYSNSDCGKPKNTCPDPISVISNPGTPGQNGIGTPGANGGSVTIQQQAGAVKFVDVFGNTGYVYNGLPGTQGAKGLNWRGDYSPVYSGGYKIDDAVSYLGSSYVAIVNNPIFAPNILNIEWNVLALKGNKGDDGNPGTADAILGKAYIDAGLTSITNTIPRIIQFNKTEINSNVGPNQIHTQGDPLINDKLYCIADGVYLISGQTTISGITDGNVIIKTLLNGSIIVDERIYEVDNISAIESPLPETKSIIIPSIPYSLVVGDYISFEVSTTNTTTIDLVFGNTKTWASIGRWVSQQSGNNTGPNGGLTVIEFRESALDPYVLELEKDMLPSPVIDSVDLNSKFIKAQTAIVQPVSSRISGQHEAGAFKLITPINEGVAVTKVATIDSTGVIKYRTSSEFISDIPSIITSISLTTDNIIYDTPVNFNTVANASTGTLVLKTQSPNTFLAGPTAGPDSAPTFRTITINDLPDLTNDYIKNGIVSQIAAFHITNNGILATDVNSYLLVGAASPPVSNYKAQVIADATRINGLYIKGGSSTIGNILLAENLAGTAYLRGENDGTLHIKDTSSVNSILLITGSNIYNRGQQLISILNFSVDRQLTVFGSEATAGIINFRAGQNGITNEIKGHQSQSVSIWKARNHVNTASVEFTSAGVLVTNGVSSTTGSSAQFKNLAGTILLDVLNNGNNYLRKEGGKIGYLNSGANKSIGDVTLIAGTATVNTNAITTNSIVKLTRKTIGGTPGFTSYTIVNGVSFTVTSDSITDTSTFEYFLIDKI